MNTLFDKSAYVRSCRRLPLHLDIERLQQEVRLLPDPLWEHNRARVHRETRALFLKGHPPLANIPDDPEQPALRQCPYIRELLYELIPGVPGKCLLAALKPRGLVYPHKDAANAYFRGSLRIHIPVFTNPEVRFFNNGRFFKMLQGEVWTVNNLVPHAVTNDHPARERVHLIFDVFPDAAALAIVASVGEAAGESDQMLFRRIQAKVNQLREARTADKRG